MNNLFLSSAAGFFCSLASLISLASAAASCSTTLTPTSSVRPSVASGYQVALVATSVSNPRSIQFDSLGNLLVLQSGRGIVNLVLQDDGGTCVSVKSNREVLRKGDLNHGLALSQDGKTLYASSSGAAYSWTYDPEKASVGDTSSTIVSGMSNSDHTTRTLLLSEKANGTLVISRGSNSNVDLDANKLSSGHSQIKTFDLTKVPDNGYDFTSDGTRIGWGLRNSVGLAEHPATGGIFSVENSVDQIMREGKDIHQDNPGEEMNFHGFLNGTEYAAQGSNYGYPNCFAAWLVGDIPQNANLSVGSQFAIGDQSSTINDTFCAEQTPPVLTFQAHMAPLDIVFNNSATEVWITFHGSWDRTNPVGYKLSMIPFGDDGQPVAAPDNNTAAIDILSNADNSVCPKQCFRPVGIAFDKQGRLFVSSDKTDEIYVVVKDQTSSETPSSSSPSATSSSKSGSGKKLKSAAILKIVSFALGAVMVIFFY